MFGEASNAFGNEHGGVSDYWTKLRTSAVDMGGINVPDMGDGARLPAELVAAHPDGVALGGRVSLGETVAVVWPPDVNL